MASKYESEKENLIDLIITQGLTYEEVGRRYNCTGSNIKKVAKRLGIELPQRRKVNESETFNKGSGPQTYCLNCGKNISHKYKNIYCDSKCQTEYTYKTYIENWLLGKESGSTNSMNVSSHVKHYLFEIHESKCEQCGWNEVNSITGSVPLQIHHVNGDSENNTKENLELLCPNCHSLTDNFGSLNTDSKRVYRRKNANT